MRLRLRRVDRRRERREPRRDLRDPRRRRRPPAWSEWLRLRLRREARRDRRVDRRRRRPPFNEGVPVRLNGAAALLIGFYSTARFLLGWVGQK